MRLLALSLALFVAGPIGCQARADDAGTTPSVVQGVSLFMRIYGSSWPPAGFTRYCDQNPSGCLSHGGDRRPELSPAALEDLDAINRLVNTAAQAATDRDVYGIPEYWTLPADRGDCEDYALLKQKILVSRGWPTGSLLLTVVRDEAGDGHAVLTAHTSQGDFILDNKVPVIRPWTETDYRYVMRQSFLDPRVWVSLDPVDAAAPPSLAGVE